MAKPDDRSDNVERLQKMIHNTEDNYREAKDYYKAHANEISDEEKARIKEKNERRADSMSAFRSEIRDERKDGF